MRQNLLGKEERSKMRQKCVKFASKMHQKCAEHLWGRTPFGRYRNGQGWAKETIHHFGAPTPGLFLAKCSAEKTKYIDVSQPPHAKFGNYFLGKIRISAAQRNVFGAHRNRSDFCDLRLRCPSLTPEIAAISETRESNAALRFKGAMESR